MAQAQAFVAEGYQWVVDIDLEKFFDQVSRTGFVARVAEQVSDKRVLNGHPRFLEAGVLENGLVSPTDEEFQVVPCRLC